MSANTSNPRLDRIERLIEQRKRANKEAQARHEREMADIRAEGRKTRDNLPRTRDESRRFRDFLRRWAALSAREARDQRKRQRAIDLNLTRLAAAQLVTKKLLANFVASRATGPNGGGHRRRT